MAPQPGPAGPGSPHATTPPAAAGAVASVPPVWRVLSALSLLAMGGLHLYLVITSTGGVLGVLFLLNAAGGLVLAVAVLTTRGTLLRVSTVLALVFLAGTLLALVLALTVGLFGLRSSLDYDLAPTTLVVESLGTVVLAVTTALVLRPARREP